MLFFFFFMFYFVINQCGTVSRSPCLFPSSCCAEVTSPSQRTTSAFCHHLTASIYSPRHIVSNSSCLLIWLAGKIDSIFADTVTFSAKHPTYKVKNRDKHQLFIVTLTNFHRTTFPLYQLFSCRKMWDYLCLFLNS